MPNTKSAVRRVRRVKSRQESIELEKVSIKTVSTWKV